MFAKPILLQRRFYIFAVSILRPVVFRPTVITHVHPSVNTLIIIILFYFILSYFIFCEKEINAFLLK